MATAATRRRKYLFPSRAAAEEAWKDADCREHRMFRLARALYSHTITWGDRRGAYRFGLFDTSTGCGPRVVRVFHPSTGQEPDLAVYDPYGEDLRLIEECAARSNGPESIHILACIQEVRNFLTIITT